MRMIPTTRAASMPSRKVTISASNMGVRSPGLAGASGHGSAPAPGGRGCGRGALQVAPLAVAADLVRVSRHAELLPAADLVLEALDIPALELDDPAAAEAHHVIVMVAPEHRLVARLPLGHLHLVDETGLDEPG